MSDEIFGYIGLKQEPEFGEDSAAVEVLGEVMEDSISMDNNLIARSLIDGTRYKKYIGTGPVSGSGGLVMNLMPEGITPWLVKGLLGSVNSSEIAAGVRQHVFSVNGTSALPSFSIRSGYETLAQAWRGCSVNEATIAFSKSETLTFSAQVTAQRPEEATDSPTPVFSSLKPFSGADVSFLFGGSSDLRFESFSVTLDNFIEPVYKHNMKRWCGSHSAHEFAVRGSFTLEFESEAERRRMWGSLVSTGPQKVIQPTHLSLIASQAAEIAPGYSYYFKLDLPEIYIESAPAGIRRSADRILQSVNFMAVYSRDHDKLADIVMRNSIASYPDPA